MSDLVSRLQEAATFDEHLEQGGGRADLLREAAHAIAELELIKRQDEQRIRELETRRFEPAERAVLDACAEMTVKPENGRVRAPNERDIELVAEAEWARRQEHRVADGESSEP
jgi:hypothetical protein